MNHKSLIINLSNLESIKNLNKINNLEAISSFLIGINCLLEFNLENIVEVIKEFGDKEIILDLQGLNISEESKIKNIFSKLAFNKVKKVIYLPVYGPEILRKYYRISYDRNIELIINGFLDNSGYFASENGYIQDRALIDSYIQASLLGIRNVLIPGNNTRRAKRIINIFETYSKGSPTVYIRDYQLKQLDNPIDSKTENYHLIIPDISKANDPNIELAYWINALKLIGSEDAT